MIKKFKIIFLMFMLLCIPVSNISAFENDEHYTYIEESFNDGSYIEITIDCNSTNTRSNITKSKTATYKRANGTSLWSVTVKGVFNYNGSTSSCTNSSVSTKTYSTSWKLSNASSSKSDATAIAKVTAKEYHQNGTVLRAINKTVKLTCDKNGNLS